MKSQVLQTLWCNISDDTAGEIWNWSLLVISFGDVQSLLNIGAMFGSPLGGWMIDKIGRKFTFMVTAAPFVAGWLLIALGKHEGMLYAGRLLTGVAAGLASVNVPVSIARVCAETRALRDFGLVCTADEHTELMPGDTIQ